MCATSISPWRTNTALSTSASRSWITSSVSSRVQCLTKAQMSALTMCHWRRIIWLYISSSLFKRKRCQPIVCPTYERCSLYASKAYCTQRSQTSKLHYDNKRLLIVSTRKTYFWIKTEMSWLFKDQTRVWRTPKDLQYVVDSRSNQLGFWSFRGSVRYSLKGTSPLNWRAQWNCVPDKSNRPVLSTTFSSSFIHSKSLALIKSLWLGGIDHI